MGNMKKVKASLSEEVVHEFVSEGGVLGDCFDDPLAEEGADSLAGVLPRRDDNAVLGSPLLRRYSQAGNVVAQLRFPRDFSSHADVLIERLRDLLEESQQFGEGIGRAQGNVHVFPCLKSIREVDAPKPFHTLAVSKLRLHAPKSN